MESKNLPNIWISIEGNISSGKSTFLSYLKRSVASGDTFDMKGYDVYFIDEDIEAWGKEIFTHYYSNPSRWAFTFQFKVIAVRAMQIRNVQNAIMRSGRPGLIISERSLESSKHIFTEMCNKAGFINPVEQETYDLCYDVMNNFTHTNFYLYCTTPPDICKERYLKRSREGETLDIDYLKKCHEHHEKWLQGNERVINIDTSDDATEDNLSKWSKKIKEVLHRQ